MQARLIFVPRTLGINFSPNRAFRSLHSLTADASMALVALHFALSWESVVTMTRRYLLNPITRLFHRRQPILVPVEAGNETKQG